ncbi:MAG: LysR family transcriptional regulator [Pseudomonadota bacterium]
MEDIRPIRIFLEVARQQSFVGAARHFNLTPSTVTRTIARLEEDLGQQLLLRTTRKVSLTAIGATVAARYRPLIEDLDATTQQITRESRPDRGHLRLNAPLSMGVRLLPGLLAAFREAYPQVSISVDLSDRLIDIIDDPFDLSIRISRPPMDVSTIWRKICVVPRKIVAAPGLLTRIGTPRTPDDLMPEHCLSYSDNGTPETWVLTKGGLTRKLRAGDQVMVNNGDLLCAMAAGGQGMTLLPDFLVVDALASGDVVTVLGAWEAEPLWLTLFYPPYEQFPPLVASFTDFFETYLQTERAGEFQFS